MSRCTVLIVAAGRGTRVSGSEIPKQYREIGGVPVLTHSLDTYLLHPRQFTIAVVIAPDDKELYRAIAPADSRLLSPVQGGASRQESVLAGLRSLADDSPDTVLVHDAARPFVTADLIERVVSGLDRNDAVLPATPIDSTLKSVDESGVVSATVPRAGLYAAQTPQGFRYRAILDAHEKAAAAGMTFTDDAAVAEWAGIPVRIVAGDAGNAKLTTAADVDAADRRLALQAALPLGEVRVATGYDVHAFGPGDSVMMGGVRIPSERGVVSHSDGDVVLHALVDAILGAIADGDIGVHFPPSDPQWKDASSDRFLRFAVDRVVALGGVIGHLDVTIVTETPRISAFRTEIRDRIAEICGVAVDRVGLKATTGEGLGFVGRREGLAASATATIRLPLKAST